MTWPWMSGRTIAARRNGSSICGFCAGVAVCIAYTLGHGAQANAIAIYDLSASAPDSGAYAYGVSGNGSVVVGAIIGSDPWQAFQWSAGEGFTELEPIGGFAGSRATASNADGSVIVGDARSSNHSTYRATRWTSAGAQDLGVLNSGDTRSDALRVSSDGTAIVGTSYSQNGVGQAYRWTESDGMQSLGPSSLSFTIGRDISHDGNVVVGYGRNELGGHTAFRWSTEGGEMIALDSLPSETSSIAYAVSGDGQYTFGSSGSIGVRWDSAGNIQELGVPEGGNGATFMSANADGSVAVGFDYSYGQSVLWTPSTGVVYIYDYLVSSGVDLTGWSRQDFGYAFDVSDDGSTIVGNGFVITGLSFSSVPGPGVSALVALGCGSRRRRHRFRGH